MNLLFDEDYEVLRNSGLEYMEDFSQRFLIITNYPLNEGQYVFNGEPIHSVEVLSVIPINYNMEGTDMFWTHPFLTRADGQAIPATMQFGGGDKRIFGGKEYCRWSRHFPAGSWKGKIDNVQKILSRIEWALRNPDTVK